jgi:large subunit ribosomal protein L13
VKPWAKRIIGSEDNNQSLDGNVLMETSFRTKEEAIKLRGWRVVDASDQVVGRLATKIAMVLKGKDNPIYAPHNDSGDFVIVINAEKIRFTGNKLTGKKYYRHTGFIGGLYDETAGELLARKPEAVIRKAVKGMLPKNTLGRAQLRKLKIYAGPEHPHEAQQPVEL